jgi:spore coat protein H
MASRRVLAGAFLALVMLVEARSAATQTADDLFNDQVLHRIDLWVNTKDWYLLRANYQSNDYYPANMKWNGLTTTNVAIRSRGFGSRSGTKPALRVDFNRYVTGRTFLGLKAIDLNNLIQDASNLREVLAMKFSRSMGIPAPRIAQCALYINNAYFGLYIIVEEIDEVSVARLLGESTGHLFEYRWQFYYYLEYLGRDLGAYASIYSPVTRETESAGALYGPIEAMTRTITDASDENFVPAVSQYLDLPVFMRFVAVQAFIAECDGVLGNWGVNNHFLYRFNEKDLSQFIAWDASSSFHALDYPIDAGHAENVLMRRSMTVPDLHTLYFSTVLDAAAFNDQTETPGQPGPGWLEREATRLLELIRSAAYADTVKPYTNDEFDQAANSILTFARTRSEFVRGEVSRLARVDGQPGVRAFVRR